MTNASSEARTQFLSFVLAGDEYAVDILRVKEIIEYGTLTRVPGMPAAVRGVINLRGRVVPVVDLALRFGLPSIAITPRSCIVMVEITGNGGQDGADGAIVIGVITDAVSEVLDLAADQIQPPPSFGTSVGAEFLDGMAETDGKKFVMLLNIDRALGADAFTQTI
ncbi:MAG TPA: chemotaxis protein CheW [Gemmatimonadaceae bacterium]|nr:chemotaxis protein CheW [Gemmatimonadaceae bacterium]